MASDLPHIIIDTVTGEMPVGGIRVSALRNRVSAACVGIGNKPPTPEEFNDALFDLLSNETLEMRDKFVRLPHPLLSDNLVSHWETEIPVSGWDPCGPGDMLYNSKGQAVGRVRRMTRTTDISGKAMWGMEVEGVFSALIETKPHGEEIDFTTSEQADWSKTPDQYLAGLTKTSKSTVIHGNRNYITNWK